MDYFYFYFFIFFVFSKSFSVNFINRFINLDINKSESLKYSCYSFIISWTLYLIIDKYLINYINFKYVDILYLSLFPFIFSFFLVKNINLLTSLIISIIVYSINMFIYGFIYYLWLKDTDHSFLSIIETNNINLFKITMTFLIFVFIFYISINVTQHRTILDLRKQESLLYSIYSFIFTFFVFIPFIILFELLEIYFYFESIIFIHIISFSILLFKNEQYNFIKSIFYSIFVVFLTILLFILISFLTEKINYLDFYYNIFYLKEMINF